MKFNSIVTFGFVLSAMITGSVALAEPAAQVDPGKAPPAPATMSKQDVQIAAIAAKLKRYEVPRDPNKMSCNEVTTEMNRSADDAMLFTMASVSNGGFVSALSQKAAAIIEQNSMGPIRAKFKSCELQATRDAELERAQEDVATAKHQAKLAKLREEADAIRSGATAPAATGTSAQVARTNVRR